MSCAAATGQPIGPAVENWQPCESPRHELLEGSWCRLEPIDPERHADELWGAVREEELWTYLPYGPFGSVDAYRSFMRALCTGADPLFFAIAPRTTGRAAGLASFLRIDAPVGVVEVGHLLFSPPLQRTAAATEAMFLMMRHVFQELGYRRYEWKCDALNARSRRAAERLGFRFEGIFRQATIYKGRNRDTAWYSILDTEWPALRDGLAAWLEPANFVAEGRQRRPLSALL